MSFISNNCIIYSTDADLIGKLVISGHKVHYDDDILSLVKKIGEINPDLIIIDLFKEVDPSYISALIQINGYLLIRGSLPTHLISEINNKRIIILPDETTNADIIEKIAHLGESPEEKGISEKKKVLIIEDNLDILEMYSVAFTSRWYDVSLATDWLNGMTKAVNLRPDIIILDIMMPHMDGFEVLHTLKNNTSLQAIVVVNSNLEWVDEERRVKELWAEYFLRKSSHTPLDVVSFIEKEIYHIEKK